MACGSLYVRENLGEVRLAAMSAEGVNDVAAEKVLRRDLAG
jgi:hypothetical protein